MGNAARRATDALRASLAERLSDYDWRLEQSLGEARVDLVGEGPVQVLIELEWRRADPVNNTVSLLRELGEDRTPSGPVVVCQLFTRYYTLEPGGYSIRRRNAEFAGDLADDQLPDVTCHPITFDIDPPRGEGDLPSGWRETVETAVDRIVAAVEAASD